MSFYERLDSSHLYGTRLEQFRVMRDMMLQRIGSQTIVLSNQYPDVPVGTVVVKEPQYASPNDSGFVLMMGAMLHRLKIGCNTIGRLTDNDIVIHDEERLVSRRHCSIIVHTDGTAEVFDTSLNGTYVNEKMVTHGAIKSGDRLRIGPKFSIDIVLY
ncbi:MAG: FHA domain-containing protein [Blastocatellia bacterium]|nr:FHA domain-containing protein [Blastocatellia bacterium]